MGWIQIEHSVNRKQKDPAETFLWNKEWAGQLYHILFRLHCLSGQLSRKAAEQNNPTKH